MLVPHVDRLLGDVAVLHSPFFGSGKLEYYLATRRPGLEVRGVDAFEPVANLHRCYLRQDPVFLRSLLRLAGRKIDRRFYFSRLLPGAQRGRAGRRATCSYVLLRNSFSGKWGSFAQQRPLALSCQPGARVGALGQQRPVQRAERGVHPVEVATAISRQKAVRDSDLVDSQPGVALQVQGLSQVYLEVAV